MATATVRRSLYKLTRPCEQGVDCPDDREPKACEAAQNRHASKCPFCRSSHPIRRGSFMHQLDQGVPKEILSDRVDVSKPVLDKHYDRRSEVRKRRLRCAKLAKQVDGYETDA